MVLKQKKETEGLGRSASSPLTAKAGASTIRNAGISQYSQTQLLFPKQSQCNRFDVLNAFHTTNIQYLLYVCKCTMCVYIRLLSLLTTNTSENTLCLTVSVAVFQATHLHIE